MKKLRIGSRDSQLAVAQTMLVIDKLQQLLPNTTIELITMKTMGDRVLDRALDQVGGKGLFVRELDDALRSEQVDLTVHSLKDLPAELPEDLPLGAFFERGDPRDALIFAQGVTEETLLTKGGVIGSSGKRRIFQLGQRYPQAQFALMRGNVQTRLRKLAEEPFDATVLAMAGLTRLGLSAMAGRIFSTDEVIPAAGQGILAVQCRKGFVLPELERINDGSSQAAALAERSFVRRLEGGCSAPTAAYAEVSGQELRLTGIYVEEATGCFARGSLCGAMSESERIGEKLAMLLKQQVEEPK